MVIAQVNEVVDRLPRVDYPSDRVDFVIKVERHFYLEPLFTRDHAHGLVCSVNLLAQCQPAGISMRARWF